MNLRVHFALSLKSIRKEFRVSASSAIVVVLWIVFLGFFANALNTDSVRTGDVSNYFVNLRREKMQDLKKELAEKGAGISSPDVDPKMFSGIRRLKILQAKAHVTHDQRPMVTITSTKIDVEHHPTHSPLVLSESSDGLSTGVSIAIAISTAVLLVLICYVVYKYMKWKPKMVARKGYRAVSKSRGLASASENAADSSDNTPTLLQAQVGSSSHPKH